jgi:hypothetical protein
VEFKISLEHHLVLDKQRQFQLLLSCNFLKIYFQLQIDENGDNIMNAFVREFNFLHTPDFIHHVLAPAGILDEPAIYSSVSPAIEKRIFDPSIAGPLVDAIKIAYKVACNRAERVGLLYQHRDRFERFAGCSCSTASTIVCRQHHHFTVYEENCALCAIFARLWDVIVDNSCSRFRRCKLPYSIALLRPSHSELTAMAELGIRSEKRQPTNNVAKLLSWIRQPWIDSASCKLCEVFRIKPIELFLGTVFYEKLREDDYRYGPIESIGVEYLYLEEPIDYEGNHDLYLNAKQYFIPYMFEPIDGYVINLKDFFEKFSNIINQATDLDPLIVDLFHELIEAYKSQSYLVANKIITKQRQLISGLNHFEEYLQNVQDIRTHEQWLDHVAHSEEAIRAASTGSVVDWGRLPAPVDPAFLEPNARHDSRTPTPTPSPPASIHEDEQPDDVRMDTLGPQVPRPLGFELTITQAFLLCHNYVDNYRVVALNPLGYLEHPGPNSVDLPHVSDNIHGPNRLVHLDFVSCRWKFVADIDHTGWHRIRPTYRYYWREDGAFRGVDNFCRPSQYKESLMLHIESTYAAFPHYDSTQPFTHITVISIDVAKIVYKENLFILQCGGPCLWRVDYGNPTNSEIVLQALMMRRQRLRLEYLGNHPQQYPPVYTGVLGDISNDTQNVFRRPPTLR